MGINFNELPDNKPVSLPDKGTYIATIEKAEMKQGQDASKPPYLNLLLALQTPDGKPAGKIYDIISESAHELVRFKVKRFVMATEIPIVGNFELRDLVKVLPNKQLIVDVTHEEKDGRQPKGIVDIFAGGIYYPMSQRAEVFGETAAVDADEIGAIFAPDATDADAPPFAADPAPAPAPKAKAKSEPAEY